jgi:serralysin
MADKPFFTIEQVTAQLGRFNISWPAGGTITYSFIDSVSREDVGGARWAGFTPFSAEQRVGAREVFRELAELTTLRFVEAQDNGSGADRITLGNVPGTLSMGTPVSRPGATPGATRVAFEGEVTIGLGSVFDAPGFWVPRGVNYWLLAHEIGHAMGLAHPADYPVGVRSDYDLHAVYFQDSRQYSVMSPFVPSKTGAVDRLDPSSPALTWPVASYLLHDVATLQAKYGPNLATRAGDTVYGFNASADASRFAVDGARPPVFVIWDGGGRDTLDLSGYRSGSNLDLNAGAFSDMGGLRGNVAIAFGAVIENGFGGAGDDTVTGNAAGNHLTGGDGRDFVRGLEGSDTVDGGSGDDDVNGNRGDDTVHGGFGADTVRGGQDQDVVYSGEGDDPHVNGNVGDDTVWAGGGNDTLFGGQGSDRLYGELGDDRLAGDLGADLLTGGGGADRFVASAGGGFDWVTDFSSAEGDRIFIAPGVTWHVRAHEGQAVIDLGGGDAIGLVGVAPEAMGEWLATG